MPNKININDLIGKPFKSEARGPDNFDCYGLVMEVFKRQGINIPDYGKGILAKQLAIIDRAVWDAEIEWEEIKKPVPGCLVVIAFPNPGWASHLGVMIDTDKFINMRSKTGAVIDRISSAAWKKRIVGYYKYKGTNDRQSINNDS